MQTPPTQPAVVIRERGEPTSIIRIAVGIVLGLAITGGMVAAGLFGYGAYRESSARAAAATAAKAEADYFTANAKVYQVNLEEFGDVYGTTNTYTLFIRALDEHDANMRSMAVTAGRTMSSTGIHPAPAGTQENTSTWMNTKQVTRWAK